MRKIGFIALLVALIVGIGYLQGVANSQAATLVDRTTGQLEGGDWQTWVQEMQVPSVAGLLLFEPDNAPCVYAGGVTATGCSEPQAPVWTAVGWAGTALATQWTLYYELGHQFDWKYLTDADRAQFAAQWHTDLPWADTQAGIEAGTEDGLEGIFPEVYADCALGTDPAGETISFSDQTTPVTISMDTISQDSCALIDTIGQEQGADADSSPIAVSPPAPLPIWPKGSAATDHAGYGYGDTPLTATS